MKKYGTVICIIIIVCFMRLHIYRQLCICVCASDDKSKENPECTGSGCEEEVVIMQFVLYVLNKSMLSGF